MKTLSRWLIRVLATLVVWTGSTAYGQADAEGKLRRYLYVAQPGIRNYLEYGGHGVLVYDIDNDYEFVRRIPTGGYENDGTTPINVKGVCGNAETGRLYISTIKHLICLDLKTDEVLWEKTFPQGCDRMSLSPDGKIMYLPSFEEDIWYIVDAMTGEEIARNQPDSNAHNTVYGNDGKFVYQGGSGSNILSVADTTTHKIVKEIGPFSNNIRPLTINGSQTYCYVNVDDLLGFEVGDLQSGKMIYRVEVEGYEKGPVDRHGCPSHGIAMTPDETEIWLADGPNSRIHIYDATVMPPKQVDTIDLRKQPGWITFSIDGKTCWPSSGEVIDVATRKIVKGLEDEEGRMMMSEKLLEVNFRDGQVVAVGDQFGKGYK